MSLEGELPPDELAPAAPGSERLERVVAGILRRSQGWRVPSAVSLNGVKWTPHLVGEKPSRVLHVHLSDGMPRYIRTRLVAARDAGYQIHVAAGLDALYREEVLSVLGDVDAQFHLVKEDDAASRSSHALAAVADLQVPVAPALRTSLARSVWARLREGTKHQKGRRLEALLAFLLSQVSDFRVTERNFRGNTDEIDLVVQVDNYSPRCWHESGVPFLLAEAKNRSERAGQPQISLLIRRLQTKRGRARIGLFFSVGGFTSDAANEELKLAETKLCVVMLDASAIQAWIDSDDFDGHLEALVRRGMLR